MIGTTYMPSIHAAFKPHFLFNVQFHIPYQTCTLSASLAVRLYCLRFAFAFTLDLEVE